MRHYYRVVRYLENEGCHMCENQEGGEEKIDLLVSGELPLNVSAKSLVGRVISCSYTYPYVSIAMGVKVEENEDE